MIHVWDHFSLLNDKKYSGDPEYIKYYGQEQNTSTYTMNMFLHGVKAENQNLRNGDTLDADWPTDEDTDFNMVLMNPPYDLQRNGVHHLDFCRMKDSVIIIKG